MLGQEEVPGGYIQIAYYEKDLWYLIIARNQYEYRSDRKIAEFLGITIPQYKEFYIVNNIDICISSGGSIFFRNFENGCLALKIIKDKFDNQFLTSTILNE